MSIYIATTRTWLLKQSHRLNVLRSVISETNNAGKTQRPIETDFQLLTLLNKRTHSLQEAASEFGKAGRDDLKNKATEELAVLETYANQVQTMSSEEIQSIVSSVISNLEQKTLNVGSVMKALVAPGGALEGKPAVRADVAKIVEKTVGEAKGATA